VIKAKRYYKVLVEAEGSSKGSKLLIALLNSTLFKGRDDIKLRVKFRFTNSI